MVDVELATSSLHYLAAHQPEYETAVPSKRRVLGQCVGTGSATKTEAIDLALRRLAGQPMSREEALAMRGAAASVLAHDRGFARIADVVDLTLDQYSIRA